MQVFDWATLNTERQTALLQRPVYNADNDDVLQIVTDIIADVRAQGDDALVRYTKEFDQTDLDTIKVSEADIQKAGDEVTNDLKQAIQIAYANIKRFHEAQGAKAYSVETMPGVSCQRIVRPIDRVGLYIPAGSAPLFSTVLMVAIPAQIAGCENRILCSPASKGKPIHPAILYAASLCGITEIFQIGGAQAVAAMAYGTDSVPKVDKIFGPGNQYVTQAKKYVAQDPQGALLDMPAGPSEVCVIVNETTPADFAAADLLSQAEHDPLSQVVLISDTKAKADEIIDAVETQLSNLPRQDIANAALENSVCIVSGSMDQSIEIANMYAAEHLILCFDDADNCVDRITNAGSIFCGVWTPESAGDYASGTNHVLPTYGYARTYSGLSVEAFQKTMTVQSITKQGLQALGPHVMTMAQAEELDAHAQAVSVRLESLHKDS